MADNRDYRIRMDLSFPPEAKQHMEKIRDALLPLYRNAIDINPDKPNEEKGFISVERCGHRIGESCEIIERYDVE